MSYCSYVNGLPAAEDNVNRNYHNNHYGFPIAEDNELFGRLIMEINQAGLSWTTILKKEDAFRKAYHNFNIARIAKYTDKDRERLLNDAGIIRNRLKVNAAIENAKAVTRLQKEFGSFKNWIEHYHPKTREEWVKIFKTTFKFTGGEIVNEFLMSAGYLPGAHTTDCPVYKRILKCKPAWSR
ncbi:MAG TPA: DNA-3-methyladenine glycosylase I [Agriterribacter sp.]|nr:DNA-3-methyladenine glycosylase I [Chitinophagaceae bacterium]HRP31047.1 DNA-3-methyladenine glycosylase I [Agriterribacter sp.]